MPNRTDGVLLNFGQQSLRAKFLAASYGFTFLFRPTIWRRDDQPTNALAPSIQPHFFAPTKRAEMIAKC